jgi:hypothetical protein
VRIGDEWEDVWSLGAATCKFYREGEADAPGAVRDSRQENVILQSGATVCMAVSGATEVEDVLECASGREVQHAFMPINLPQ